MRGFAVSARPRTSHNMMKIETLIVTIDQPDHALVEKMNVQTDALVGNQCGRNATEVFLWRERHITYLNTSERGVGKNRNLLLENTTADICVLADDDMVFVDGYPQIAEKAFSECPHADILVFNLIEKHPRRFVNKRIRRIGFHNYGRYGAARLAFRREALLASGIRFHLLFGGGAAYGAGEDTIFLHDCLKQGLRIYAVPYALAEIDQEAPSTWFTGYHTQFFHDKGALYACLYPRTWPLYVLRYLLCHRKKCLQSLSFPQALHHMFAGGKNYLKEHNDT